MQDLELSFTCLGTGVLSLLRMFLKAFTDSVCFAVSETSFQALIEEGKKNCNKGLFGH